MNSFQVQVVGCLVGDLAHKFVKKSDDQLICASEGSVVLLGARDNLHYKF